MWKVLLITLGGGLGTALRYGLGVGMLPDFLADEHLAGGKLVRLFEDLAMPEASISFVRPPGGQAPRRVQGKVNGTQLEGTIQGAGGDPAGRVSLRYLE